MTERSFSLVVASAALMLVVGVGCSKTPEAVPGTAELSASQSSTPATSPAPGAEPAPAASAQVISGTVAETMDAANYTYVRLDTGKEQVWIAASQFAVKVGETLSVVPEMPMENFHSRALNRDFPLIYFVSKVGRDGQAPVAAPAGAVPAMMTSRGMVPGAGSAAQTVVVGKIDPPAGGLSIADVWAQRDALAGKTVIVRGKVVKYNADIMGHNWLHIQDGSGSAGDKTNDLTITTNDVAKLGDVVTVTGTLATKKDFGAGYAYDAIVEKGTVKVQ